MLLLAPVLLIALALVPTRSANTSPKTLASLIAITLLFALFDITLVAILAFAGSFEALQPLVSAIPNPLSSLLSNAPGLYLDGVAGTMAALISFIGWAIVRFSTRYLDGEATQGRFMKWLGFTLGAVLLMVLAGNLILLAGAWALTSLGLHKLLTHYQDRKEGLLAARKKFIYSRLGDVFVVSAIAAIYYTYGAFQYTTLFEQVATNDSVAPWQTNLIAVLLAMGAITKSAQFPLHTWLPDTMETPTPVSALMHAGIINGGGFLLVRLNSLVSSSSVALTLLAAIGGLTAVLGAVVMLCQTSVKRKLAYSTIAQMGFMTLQCGLGAFSAALLHIVAHSLYKAHAFLSAGGAAQGVARPVTPLPARTGAKVGAAALIGRAVTATVIASGLVVGCLWLFGLDEKLSGAIVLLPLALVLAIAHFLATALSTGLPAVMLRTVALAGLACASYCLALVVFGFLLPHQHATAAAHTAVIIALGVGFVLASAMYGLLPVTNRSRSLQSLYVHASSGFYIDIFMARITRRCVPVLVKAHATATRRNTTLNLEKPNA
ncbi:MAG: proton-conducting transporter membrane subunit [Aureliella sp.]